MASSIGPNILLSGQGGVVPDWNRSRAQAISLAAAGLDLQQRRQAALLAQSQQQANAAAQQIITQAAINGSGLGPTPINSGAVSTASTPGPGGTTAIPASAPDGTTRTPEGFLVRPDSATASAVPGSGGYVGSGADATTDSAVPDAPADAAPVSQTATPAPAQPQTPDDQSTSQPTDGDNDSPDTGPVSVADAASPAAPSDSGQPGLAQMAVDSLPPAYQAPAPASAPAAPTPPTPQLTPYQQLAKRAGVANPILKSNPYDLITETKRQLLNSGLPNASAMADAYEQNAVKQVEAVAASKAAQSLSVNKATLTRHQSASDAFTNFYNGNGSEAQRAASWPAWLAGQVRNGDLTSDEVGAYQQYPGDNIAKQIATHWKGDQAIAKAVIDQQTAAKSAAEAANQNAEAGYRKSQQAGEDQKNAEAARGADHAALSGVALSGLPALIKAYDALPEARKAQVAINPHNLDATKYDPKVVAAQLAYSGLSPEQQRLTNEAAAKMAEYGSPVEMNRRAEMGDPIAIRVRKSMNDQAVRLAVARGEAARAAKAVTLPPSTIPSGPPISSITGKPKILIVDPDGHNSYFDTQSQADAHKKLIADAQGK